MDGIMKNIDTIMNYGIGSFKLATIVQALLVVIVCLIVIKIIMKIVNKAISKTNLEKGVHTFVKSVTKIILYVITVLIVADTLGIPVTSLIALLSVAGLAVSLAIQDSLSNLASGLVILLTKPFKSGDYIEAGSFGGTVTEIGLSYTKLITPDNKFISVPNSQVCSSVITDYSTEATRRVELKFEADYECNIDDVKKVITDVIKKNEMVLKTPEPFVRVLSYKESSIEYVVRVWVESANYWTVYFDLLENVKRAFDKNKIIMTYNHLNVHLLNK